MKRTNTTLNRESLLSKVGKSVMLSNLSKSNSAFLIFFNQYYGSTIVGVNNLKFKLTAVSYDNIGDIKTSESEGKLFNIRGCVRWISKPTLSSSLKSPSKQLREGVIMGYSSFCSSRGGGWRILSVRGLEIFRNFLHVQGSSSACPGFENICP